METLDILSALLREAGQVLAAKAEADKQSGNDFNIFSVLNMKTDEVNTHCRLLYELLSPRGSHAMGDAFLKEFFRMVLCKPFPSGPVRVYREYPITRKSRGRIDLLIEGKDLCYPIEVKINAGDQELQVRRYADYASYAKENRVYYLTLFGNEPSEQSTGTDNKPDVVCLAFSREIREWLIKCKEMSASIPAVSEVIKQYIDLLDDLTYKEQEDEYINSIKQLVTSSSGSYMSAAAIAGVMPAVYTDMMRSVFDEIREHIGGRLKLMNADYQEKSIDYNYEPSDRVFPNIVYSLTNQDGLILCLIIEVYWRLYMGLAYYDQEGNRLAEESQELLEAGNGEAWDELFSTLQLLNGWKDAWIHELPYESPIDFWNADGIFPELFDKKRYNEIMEQIFNEIDEMICKLDNLGLIDEV